MDKNDPQPQQPGGAQPKAQPAEHHPKSPFKDDAPVKEPDPEEEAELEQQRKETLTERD